jgi:hypothetical protein
VERRVAAVVPVAEARTAQEEEEEEDESMHLQWREEGPAEETPPLPSFLLQCPTGMKPAAAAAAVQAP